MHHAPSTPPASSRIAAATTRWMRRLRAVVAPVAALMSLLHRTRVLPVTLAGLLIGSLAIVLPGLSSAEPRADDVALSSTAERGVSELVPPTPGGNWTSDGGAAPDASRSTRAGTSASAEADPSAEKTTEAPTTTSGSSPSSSAPGSATADAGDSAPGTTTAPGTSAAGGSTTPSTSAGNSSSSAPSTTSKPSSSAPSSSPSSASGGLEEQVLALVNAERSAAGCPAVKADSGLAAVARAHSTDMRDRDFFDHVNPDGLDPFDRAERAGVSYARAENIAWGQRDAAAVMDAWMNSSGHRANILNCSLRTLGVGVATGSGGPWWTQLFGS